MSIENLLMALPVVLGVILAVASVRDWRRKARARRELTRALEQRWQTDAPQRQEMNRVGMLGNWWKQR